MRFKIKPDVEPKAGDTRTITKFLLCPRRIGNEVRWLEKASFVQKYSIQDYPVMDGAEYCYTARRGEWNDKRWINK